MNILSVQFHSQKPFHHGEKIPVSLEIDPTAFFPSLRPNDFTILMDVKVEAAGFFELHLVASSEFETDETLEEETRKNFVNANALAIMFPYIRAFIASFTANLGDRFDSLSLPPQSFHGEVPVGEDEPVEN
ncbi:MAG: hypothetical protein AAB316_22110 [Bacteroidota bacterium]